MDFLYGTYPERHIMFTETMMHMMTKTRMWFEFGDGELPKLQRNSDKRMPWVQPYNMGLENMALDFVSR